MMTALYGCIEDTLLPIRGEKDNPMNDAMFVVHGVQFVKPVLLSNLSISPLRLRQKCFLPRRISLQQLNVFC